ncbi:MAG: hypothetical protein KAH86_01300, partial [Methanosarcinales archaeon]|nr:hypothetical protein [Methanosarcinales archaeon]
MTGCISAHMCLSRRLTSLGIIFALALIFFAIFTPVAAAAGTPDKLIVFTDKKIYTDWYSDGRQNPDVPVFKGDNTPAQTPYLYAIVLDDDGNMMTGQTVTATISDIARLDHADKGSDATHHARTNTGGTYYSLGVTLYDDGTNGDKNVGDGIYTYQWTPASRVGSTLNDDHLLINVDVTSGSLNTVETMMFTWLNCHKGDQDPHPGTHSLAEGAPALDGCTQCHIGFGHLYEDKSNDIDELGKDVHFGRMNPIVPSMAGKGNPNFEWNLSGQQSPNGHGTTAWDVVFPGSEYCYWCHYNADGGAILDYGADRGDRGDTTARPSCSQPSSTLSLGTVTCHATTEMEASPVPAWTSAAPTATLSGDPLNNIIDGESHSHASATQGAACATCHGSTHSLAMPNMAVDISSTGNINNQCTFCHDITDGSINAVSHSPSGTNCKSCHMDGSSRLDSHLVPVGVSGGVDCISCHDISGTAGYDVDFTKIDSGAHSALNSGATASTAANKKCYACHGVLAGGDADEADQPGGSHPPNYNTPRGCPDCHNNADTGTNFSAPQVVEHTESAPIVPTTGTLCSVCHNNSLTPSIGESDGYGLSTGGSPQNASTSHYLLDANVNLMTTSIHSDDCIYCHITNNLSAAWGTPFDPQNSPSYTHTAANIAQNDNCYACHGGLSAGVIFHDSGITAGGAGGPECGTCHDVGGGINDVDITLMSDSASAHRALNSGANGTAEYLECYACHGTLAGGDGTADWEDQPTNSHPPNYTTPKGCPDCHNNADSGTNFSAPQVVEHREGAPVVPTPGTLCSVCHNNSLNTPIGESDGFGLSVAGTPQNATASHYAQTAAGTLMTASESSDDCRWCHITNNLSAVWGTPFDPQSSPSYSHTPDNIALNDNCYLCHGGLSGGVIFHDSGITAGGAGGQDCVSCHEGTTGNKVHVATMNLSDSIHVNLNNLGAEVGRVENKMCYACHTDDSYITSGKVDGSSIPS